MRPLNRWKWILALVGLLAFAGAVGHESLHIEETADCKICHIQRHNPADLPVPAGAAAWTALIFGLVVVAFSVPARPFRLTRSGRAPPTPSL